jgi:hypothetical protein
MPSAVSAVADRRHLRETDTVVRRPDPEIARLRTWVTALDRFVDPILGMLVPGIGDALGTVLGFGVIRAALRRKLPPVVIARMLLNLAIDAVFGAVPLLGDVFDFLHQANKKNLDLLVERHEAKQSTPRDWAIVGVALVFLIGAVAGALWVTYQITAWVCSAL